VDKSARFRHEPTPRGAVVTAGYPLRSLEMRRTWDALAGAESAVYVGDPASGAEELAGLFGRLGADPRRGTCVEVGCGPGRMTGALAERFDRVVAVDVSPAMLDRARTNVTARNVTFRLVSGETLDGLEREIADAVICYLVLQHLPSRKVVGSYLREFARVLAPEGEAFVQVPVLGGLLGRAWRAARTPLVRLSRRPDRAAAFRGFRLTRGELERALAAAGLRVLAAAEGPSAYRFSRDRFLRLARS
jgi:SAM-dependent methyltransferase